MESSYLKRVVEMHLSITHVIYQAKSYLSQFKKNKISFYTFVGKMKVYYKFTTYCYEEFDKIGPDYDGPCLELDDTTLEMISFAQNIFAPFSEFSKVKNDVDFIVNNFTQQLGYYEEKAIKFLEIIDGMDIDIIVLSPGE